MIASYIVWKQGRGCARCAVQLRVLEFKKKRMVINARQNTPYRGKRAPAFICQSAFETPLCAVMLKKFPHIESFHCVFGNDTRTVQWAIAAAQRWPEATWNERIVGLQHSCSCSLVGKHTILRKMFKQRQNEKWSAPLGFSLMFWYGFFFLVYLYVIYPGCQIF